MMYTELFCFEGAAATDAAPCQKAVQRKRKAAPAGIAGSRGNAKLFLTLRKDAVMSVLGRRTAKIR